MKLIAILTILSAALCANASSTPWDSDFPNAVDGFIYETVHSQCSMSDYVDGIIPAETYTENGKTIYVADFSMYGDVAYGFISVRQNDSKVELVDLICPTPQ